MTLFLVALFAMTWMRKTPALSDEVARPHIARLVIHGIIGNNVSDLTEALGQAAKSPNVRGLLVVVDSPGGGVTGGERLHDAIARFASAKPVAVTMEDMGASAAYMLSVPAQHIVALPSTLTGSIGVILQRPDVTSLLGRIGVEVDAVTSGAMKDQTDPTSHLTPDGRAMLQGLVNDLFDQFVTMVATGRHMTEEKVRTLADGRAYTGHQALALGLVDELGDEEAARHWLRQRLHVSDASCPVLPLLPASRHINWFSFPHRRAALAWMFGNTLLEKFETASLDGAVAVLQL
ncbi:protease IV [Gluconobacter morbifer G707]|uniref:Protease IV n=1 Tax=Gluconobacter morbifer G707 TaxID=1088869 RepID=G6XII8_9PROT|nr:protease IV [Gluconobacter morbifer G707]